MTFFMSEQNGTAEPLNDSSQWQELKADTFDGAKREAEREQMFKGTSLHIAFQGPRGDFITLASKVRNPMNANSRGKWEVAPVPTAGDQ